MDSKTLLLRMAIVFIIVIGYMTLISYEYHKHPQWAQQQSQSQSLPQPAGPPATEASTAPSATGTESFMPATQPAVSPTQWQVIPGPSSTVPATIGSTQLFNSTYNVGVTTVPHGASIDSVALTPYRLDLGSPYPYSFQQPYADAEDDSLKQSMSTTSVTIDGQTIDLWDVDWRLLRQSAQSVTYALDVVNKVGGQIEIDKQFVVSPAQTGGDTPQGFQVALNYTVKNLSTPKSGVHDVSFDFDGPTIPMAETERSVSEVVAGYDADGSILFDSEPVTDFKAGADRDFLKNARDLPLLWLGASSNYFNAIVQFPLLKDNPAPLAHAMAIPANPSASTADRLAALRFSTDGFPLRPGEHLLLPLQVFFGPKSRDVLESAYYASFPYSYDHTLIIVSGACSFCTWVWLINALVMLLAAMHFVLRDWGLSIIALVCLVRLVLHPITKRSQVSMMKMQKLSPEMERLKKKFGEDKEGFAKAQMELYKSVGFTPVLGCLPMFLQMPIFIALWRALLTTFELRQAPFHFTWIHDLSQPDQLFKFPHPISLIFFHVSAINFLPLAMIVVSYINAKYFMPQPAAATKEQASQQKMMQYMSLFFPLMFYAFPSGLNLYYLTSTSLGIVESKIIRRHIREQEEREKNAGPTIVDAPAKKKSPAPAEPRKKGFLQRMQERAEELARQAERQKKRKKGPRQG